MAALQLESSATNCSLAPPNPNKSASYTASFNPSRLFKTVLCCLSGARLNANTLPLSCNDIGNSLPSKLGGPIDETQQQERLLWS